MRRWVLTALLCGVFLIAVPLAASAHCDSMDGPVVKAAERALETGVAEHVLIWVAPADERAVRTAFDQTRRVRALSEDARDLADRSFFELVVRLHRAAEGAPFTGLKPAGLDIGPAIPAADQALATGSIDGVLGLVEQTVRNGLRDHFIEVREKKDFEVSEVAKGREFVRAYVEYVHFVERVHEAATTAAHGHSETER